MIWHKHWWRESNGWGTRRCFFCGRKEQARYDSELAKVYWVGIEE